VDVAGGETLRHELFLRMVDEEGLIPAGEFVLAAEATGSIREIDRWVLGGAWRSRRPDTRWPSI
jgi:EAL domain-containing protein (putative c-di-GMP-specific phosphodiesterase class I)